MLARSKTCAIVGLDGTVVDVEADISPGLPAFHVVGLPDAAVQESRERVRAAIRNSGAEFPMRRITGSLAPADLRKSGPAYDLPIAMGLLMSSGQVPHTLSGSLLLGELALDGKLRPTPGMLPMVAVAKSAGVKTVFVPAVNAREAALVHGMEVMPVHIRASHRQSSPQPPSAAYPAWAAASRRAPAHPVAAIPPACPAPAPSS